MKKKFQLIFTSIILVSAGIVFGACDQDWYFDESLTLADESHGGLKNGNVVATGDVKNVTHNSATILCSANHNYKESLNIRPGILLTTNPSYATERDFTVENRYVYRFDVDIFTGSECEVELNELQPLTKYYYRAFAATNDSGYGLSSGDDYSYGEIKSFTTPIYNTPGEAVDLGLSIKWANQNIGASQPEEWGENFYWGYIEGGTYPLEDNGWHVEYEWLSYSLYTLKTYGYIDDDYNLTSSYDAATQIWGSQWRMPTKKECDELLSKCTWTKTTKNGVTVYLVTGPNSNYIYIPLHSLWTASARYSYDSYDRNWSYYLSINGYSFNDCKTDYFYRNHLFAIRPVWR